MCLPWLADAGHEAPVYPSYYPQEILIKSVDAASAQEALISGDIHAYVGRAKGSSAQSGPDLTAVESLGSIVVLSISGGPANDSMAHCETLVAAARWLDRLAPWFTFHPYPVTDFHADYLHFFDLAAAQKQKMRRAAQGETAPAMQSRDPKLAAWLADNGPPTVAGGAVVTVETVELRRLMAAHGSSMNGLLGPPWLKSGWFHAYLLLRRQAEGRPVEARTEELVRRLQAGAFASDIERINLERDMVASLMLDCGRLVAGYTIRREHYLSEYSTGIENVAFDSITGLHSEIFIRTAKLKEAPWNGWMRVGLSGRPDAAWNPIAGFTDDFGRFVWHAVGDPALFAEPHGAEFFVNRISDVQVNPAD